MPRRASRSLAAVLVGLVLAVCAAGASAEQPWKVLPPTPELPPATVAGPVHVNDIEMWRAEFGPRDGKPVIMVHGGLANANYFGRVIPFLVDEGFRVIAVDSRGHGRSTRSVQPYSYELMASDVVAMLDALRLPKADLVGWSDGGIIGIVLAIRDPERLNRVFAFGANTVPEGLIPDFDKEGVFADFEKQAGDEYEKLSPTPGQYDSFLKQIGEMWATQPRITDGQLKAIRTPVTIADGRYDEAIKQSHDRYMAAAIPDAHLMILPGVSHFAALQNPPLFARAVLDELTAPWDD
jgi:pimeloyl-ACP methyl ester carboxylesterase